MSVEWKTLPLDTKIEVGVALVACPLFPVILWVFGYPLWLQVFGFLLLVAWSCSSIVKKYKKIIMTKNKEVQKGD